jgi:3-oxoacyl-[acyl-carrier protein] reductase
MIARRHGRIINIGAVAGRAMPLIAGPHCAASKAGAGRFDPCRSEGSCAARQYGQLHRSWPHSQSNDRASRNPVGRFGTADEVAEMVAFLASPLAGFVTGSTVEMTGGEFAA